MPKQIEPDVVRRWVEMAESGMSHAQIATAEHRDPRTVERWVEQQRRVRDNLSMRQEAARAAYRDHLNVLIGQIDGLIADLRASPFDLPTHAMFGLPGSAFVLMGCEIDVSGGDE